MLLELTESRSPIEYHPVPVDDPTRRRPVISRAEQLLGWRPEVPLEEGLRRTVEWFQTQPDDVLAARTAIAGGQLDGLEPALNGHAEVMSPASVEVSQAKQGR